MNCALLLAASYLFIDVLKWTQFDDSVTLDSLLDDFFNDFDMDQNGFLHCPKLLAPKC